MATAVTKGNGFPDWVQPVYRRFVSIARSIPLRVAHPSPYLLPTESDCPRKSASVCVADRCLEAEEDDESRFEEEFNLWLSDEPLTDDEICQLMRTVERERKLEGKPPLV